MERPRSSSERIDTVVALAVALLATPQAGACGGIGSTGGGHDNLPTVAQGPFRALDTMELPRGTALVNMIVSVESLALLPRPGDAGILYYALPARPVVTPADGGVPGEPPDAGNPPPLRAIYHAAGTDPLTFTHDPAPVLTASAAWEGAEVFDPAVVEDRDGTVLLYYASAGGVGVARSADGVVFERARDDAAFTGAGWEASVPRRPSVVLRDGVYTLYYDAGGAIGAATSADGITFAPRGTGPVLSPGPAGRFDAAGVGLPFARVEHTPAGRDVVRLWFTGSTPDGTTSIGVAASFDGQTFDRLELPVFGPKGQEMYPVVRRRDEGSNLLYSITTLRDRRVVGVAVSPADVRITPSAMEP